MSQIEPYFLDASVLIDFFSKTESAEMEKLREWVLNTIADPTVQLLTNTVIILEFAKFLYYQKITVKKIREKIRQITYQYNLVVVDFDKSRMHESIKNLDRIDNTINCHAGEISLLSASNTLSPVFISSDEEALRSFRQLSRINPRKSEKMYVSGEEYS